MKRVVDSMFTVIVVSGIGLGVVKFAYLFDSSDWPPGLMVVAAFLMFFIFAGLVAWIYYAFLGDLPLLLLKTVEKNSIVLKNKTHTIEGFIKKKTFYWRFGKQFEGMFFVKIKDAYWIKGCFKSLDGQRIKEVRYVLKVTVEEDKENLRRFIRKFDTNLFGIDDFLSSLVNGFNRDCSDSLLKLYDHTETTQENLFFGIVNDFFTPKLEKVGMKYEYPEFKVL